MREAPLIWEMPRCRDALACGLIFSCGNDHAGIRYGDADAGDDLGKGIIVNTVVKLIRINIVRMFQSGNTDRVGPYAEGCFQMLGMHQKSGKLIAVFVQTEENSKAHIVNAAFHCPVHSSVW